MWRENTGTLALLVGNLDANNCAGLPCSVPTELGRRVFTIALNLGPAPQSTWLLSSRTHAMMPVVLHASPNGQMNISIELELAESRVYELVPSSL